MVLSGAGALGLVVGSFLNVVIHRLPKGKSIVAPRSACPSCGRPIPWGENVPLLSFVLLGGRCRGCRGRISLRYPLVEALTGGLFALAAWLVVVRQPGGVFDAGCWVHLAAALVFVAALVALSFIDLDTRLLPDRITKPGMAAGAVFSVAHPGLQPVAWLPDLPPAGAALLLSLAGMAAGYGALWLVARVGGKVFGREAMGLGDAKLLAMVGAFAGPVGALLAAALGLVLGLLLGLAEQARTKDPSFPFGPALAAGGAAVLLAPAEVRGGLEAFLDLMQDPRGLLVVLGVLTALLLWVRRKLPPALFYLLLALVLGMGAVYLFGPPRP